MLAAVLASAANAGLSINGDVTSGLVYSLKNADTNLEDKLSVESGNNNQGMSHVNFSATDGGKSGKGAYAFLETMIDITDKDPNMDVGGAYVGYNADKFDVRLGTLDSLTYQWVGSLNENQRYADNISIVPVKNENTDHSIQFLTKLGTVTLGAQAVLGDDMTNGDYVSYDLGAKFNLGKLSFALTHQEVGEEYAITKNGYSKSTHKFLARNTTSAGLGYEFKNLTSNKLLKDLELAATYANYSEQSTANATGQRTEDTTYSVGLRMNHTELLYQKGIANNQERFNLQHERPISKNAAVGFSAQFGTQDYYKTETTNNSKTDASKVRDTENLVAYLTMNF